MTIWSEKPTKGMPQNSCIWLDVFFVSGACVAMFDNCYKWRAYLVNYIDG